jgi:hypothetical protein
MIFSSALALLALTIGWIIALFILVLEIFILYFIWIGTNKQGWTWDESNQRWNKRGINLENLISDEKGDASLSRFQFLIFTFVIAMSLLYIVINFAPPPPKFPEIPAGILGLLGISGGSYVIAKGIQAGRDINIESADSTQSPNNAVNTPPEAGSNATITPETSEDEGSVGSNPP